MKHPPVGDQELEVLRYVSDHSPVSVRDVAEGFGEPRGLALTTVLTVMERLRKKGFLQREKSGGVFLYSPAVARQQVITGLINDFVERRLGGSISPLVAYLVQDRKLTPQELDELRQLVEGMADGDTE